MAEMSEIGLFGPQGVRFSVFFDPKWSKIKKKCVGIPYWVRFSDSPLWRAGNCEKDATICEFYSNPGGVVTTPLGWRDNPPGLELGPLRLIPPAVKNQDFYK